MFDIITFGSATRDIFLKSKTFRVVGEKKFITGKGLCFSLGSKIKVDEIYFSTGGGGTNTAATFVRQGFKVAYCGMLGQDESAEEIIKELEEFGINTSFILETKAKPTNHSIILSSSGEERTILVYLGASSALSKKDIPWPRLKAKWFYLAPLSGKLVNIFEPLVDFAIRHKIKVAVNPGNTQLLLPKEKLRRILKKVDILILNQEEASLLTKIPYQKEAELFKKIDELCPGIAIMSKGPAGVVVSDGRHIYRAEALPTKIIDRTGTGDSFGAGFLSGYIKSNGQIEQAIQLGAANSAACLQKLGAKHGLLKKGGKYRKVKVEKESCGKNNQCLIK